MACIDMNCSNCTGCPGRVKEHPPLPVQLLGDEPPFVRAEQATRFASDLLIFGAGLGIGVLLTLLVMLWAAQ